MKMLDSVKSLYANSGESIVVTDKNLLVLWKSKDSLPDFISINDFTKEFGELPKLPVHSSSILQYIDGRSVKIIPLFEDENFEGYMLTFFDADEIETLTDRSMLLKYRRNSLGNIRLAASPMIAQLDSLRQENDSDELKKLYGTVYTSLQKMLSSTVNSNEISKYYSGEFGHELLNVSQCLEETALLCEQRFKDSSCEFSAEIGSEVFMNTNRDRLKLAVINLIINGYMYNNAAEKKLVLKLYKKDSRIIIEVFDNGTAADVELMKESLSPFRAMTKYKTGEMLGLAVVNKFAEHFGGAVDFIKTDDGMTVQLSFPDEIIDQKLCFRLKRKPYVVGNFEPAICVLAKGLDFDK